jgi:hypothetical protein
MKLIDNIINLAKKALEIPHRIQIKRYEYRSQIKALNSPFIVCFSHCTAWLLQAEGIDITPDDVTLMINGRYNEWTRKNLGRRTWRKFRGKLHIVWRVQQQFIKDELRKARVDKEVVYNQNTKNEYLQEQLGNDQVVILQTAPWFKGKKLGHIILLTGIEPLKGNYITSDPFGDWRIQYATGHEGKGENLLSSIEQLDQIRCKLSLSLK